tara:strand:- start:4083 stop:4712 length:630 start_codon:yes stop_codon:yes gene_type:complete
MTELDAREAVSVRVGHARANRILLMGPPGVGKGTQAQLLARSTGLSAISTGDIFRAHIKDGTPLGTEVRALIARGRLVPDSISNAMVRDRLGRPDVESGFILDGYPRTPDQIHELDRILVAQGRRVDAVVLLSAPTAELFRRLSARADAEGRADDTPDVIRSRLDLYERETEALARCYEDRKILVRISGLGEASDVAAHVAAAVGAPAP